MNKIAIFILVTVFGLITGKTLAQETQKKSEENDRKGGFAVGGFDNARKSTDASRSIKAMEMEEKNYEIQSVPPPLPEKAAGEDVKNEDKASKQSGLKGKKSTNDGKNREDLQLRSDTTGNKAITKTRKSSGSVRRL